MPSSSVTRARVTAFRSAKLREARGSGEITEQGPVRLLAGAIRANRPWRLALGLSSALAGAAAGSTFGILYSNLWTLAALLAPWRLALATVGAITLFVVWLITRHRLWDRGALPVPTRTR